MFFEVNCNLNAGLLIFHFLQPSIFYAAALSENKQSRTTTNESTNSMFVNISWKPNSCFVLSHSSLFSIARTLTNKFWGNNCFYKLTLISPGKLWAAPCPRPLRSSLHSPSYITAACWSYVTHIYTWHFYVKYFTVPSVC